MKSEAAMGIERQALWKLFFFFFFYLGRERVISFESLVSFHLLGVVWGGALLATWNFFSVLPAWGKVPTSIESWNWTKVEDHFLWDYDSGDDVCWSLDPGKNVVWVTRVLDVLSNPWVPHSLSDEQRSPKFNLELRKTAMITLEKPSDNYVQRFLWRFSIFSFWWYEC